MKIIFCDFDGVLNVCYPKHDEFGQLFHPHFEANLKRLVDETGANIVISSSWRFDGLERMKEMWRKRNLPGLLIDITPDCAYIVDELGQMEYYDQVERGHEIQQWLAEHPEVENYVILDDDNDMLESQQDHFIRCANNSDHEDCVDIGYGLTNKCVDKAILILNQ